MGFIDGETLALGLDGGFLAPRGEVFTSLSALRAALPLQVHLPEATCSPAEPVLLVAGGPSLCLAALITGAERDRGGVLVRYRLVHRTRLPVQSGQGWLDDFFAGSPLRLEAPYHLVRLRGLDPGARVRFVREHELAVTGRLCRAGRAVYLVSDGRSETAGPGLLASYEPRGELTVQLGPFVGAVPTAWGHDPRRPGLPLALDVPQLPPRPGAYRLDRRSASALRAHVGRRVRAVGLVGGASGRELTPAFVCAGEAGELLHEDASVGWGRRLASPYLREAEPAAA
jgi:hypothetical protein